MLTFSFQVNHTHTKGLLTTNHFNFLFIDIVNGIKHFICTIYISYTSGTVTKIKNEKSIKVTPIIIARWWRREGLVFYFKSLTM